MTELKPCPFCGGEAKARGGSYAQEQTVIQCSRCFALVQGKMLEHNEIEIWNTRADSQVIVDKDKRIAGLEAQLKAAQPEVCMDNLRHCILMALNDCLVAEVGPGHSIINIDGEVLYNRVRGILDAITPLPAPPEKGQ